MGFMSIYSLIEAHDSFFQLSFLGGVKCELSDFVGENLFKVNRTISAAMCENFPLHFYLNPLNPAKTKDGETREEIFNFEHYRQFNLITFFGENF